jgi:hypothetical protein
MKGLEKNRKKREFRAGFSGKNFVVRDYTICNSWFSKLRGLMFHSRDYKKPLLFVFSKPGIYKIHSFFCRKFVGVWMLDQKIVGIRIVEPWELSVTPKEKFNLLLEIPLKTS